MTLAELCAGSAAVGLRALGNRPLCRYMGGKGRFARAILAELEVHEVPDRVVLVDPGPWGRVWSVLPRIAHDVALQIEEWTDRWPDHAALFGWLQAQPVPIVDVEYCAAFLALQQLSWRSKPVLIREGRWVHSGVDRTMAHGLPATDRFGEVRPQLPVLVGHLRSARHLDRIEGHHGRAQDLPPFAGAVYLDPPYVGTQGYGHDMTREEALELAERWEAAGSRVAMSEAEAVGGPFVRATRLGARGPSSSISLTARPREEWLSMTHHPAQLGLLEVG